MNNLEIPVKVRILDGYQFVAIRKLVQSDLYMDMNTLAGGPLIVHIATGEENTVGIVIKLKDRNWVRVALFRRASKPGIPATTSSEFVRLIEQAPNIEQTIEGMDSFVEWLTARIEY